MTYVSHHSDKFRDLTGDDAYRSWLISREQAPIVHHSGAMHWKRLRVLARLTFNHIKGLLAAVHVAIVADKMRRVQRELALRGVRYDAPPKASTDRGGR
ncbi:hypothetical protein ONR75_18390 [Rhodopseudomonas sp. P2A-2r]|uniref:hypothetical protein n=1 Tax=Rhodopseudomonas sp. P2A-2r TaxID=2991972 RepID=UPI00223477C3|nr:hypothetical protein [Rhodopseudomonas sp. P2A-2r]UZE46978.1 hypothetical protein ONR75_18390 [Rhodopseudomonas sp. P2A-2r]